MFTLPVYQFFCLFYPIDYKITLKKESNQWITILFLHSKMNQESTIREYSRIVPTLLTAFVISVAESDSPSRVVFRCHHGENDIDER